MALSPPWKVEQPKPGDGAGIAAVQNEGWMETYPDPSVGLTREDVEAAGIGSLENIAKWEKTLESQDSEDKRF